MVQKPQNPQYGTQTYVYTKDGIFVSEDGARSFKFVKETNGRIYLQQTGCVSLPFLGQIAINFYIAQKEDGNKLKESVSKAWA